MEALEVIALIIASCVISCYFALKSSKNKEKIKQKQWVVLEHEQGETGKTTRCYMAQHKTNRKASPCFNQIDTLNKWLKQNGETKTS